MATLIQDAPSDIANDRLERTESRWTPAAWRAALAALVHQPLTGPLFTLFLCVLPWSAHFLLIYPDERFYLDATVTMHQSGDLLVPRYEDGSPRLNKPLLTYWTMLASFKLFGVNILAARLPFLLAAAALLVLTWRLALLVTGQRRVARLAAWITLANPFFLLSAMRCLPDILLALFATLAVYGYFLLRSRAGADAAGAWALTLGVGLSFATKGLPALLLVGCIGLHALFAWRQFHGRLARTLAMPVLVGGAVSLAGFLPILWSHAQETVQEMWHDQFAQRLVYKGQDIFHRLPLLLAGVAVLHLAWLWPAARGMRARPVAGAGRIETNSSLGWGSFLGLTFGLWIAATVATENCSLRYLVPLFPWLAIVLAAGVVRCDREFVERYGGLVLMGGVVLMFVLVAIAGIIVVQLPGRVGAMLALAVVTAAPIWWACRRARLGALPRLQAVGAMVPATAFVAFVVMRAIVAPDFGAQARASLPSAIASGHPVAVQGSPCHVSRIRLALAPVERAARRYEALDGAIAMALVPAERVQQLPADVYEFLPAATLKDRLPWRAFAGAALKGELNAYLGAQATTYCWAIRRELCQDRQSLRAEADIDKNNASPRQPAR